jgi:hypothetical protein
MGLCLTPPVSPALSFHECFSLIVLSLEASLADYSLARRSSRLPELLLQACIARQPPGCLNRPTNGTLGLTRTRLYDNHPTGASSNSPASHRGHVDKYCPALVTFMAHFKDPILVLW